MLIIRYSFLIFVISLLFGCESNGDSDAPLSVYKITSGIKTENLLVMFPGINSKGNDFVEYGFIDSFKEHYPRTDILLVDTYLAYIQAGNIAERIQNEIIVPAYQHGYTNIWFVGVSLGGLGALMYNKEFSGNISGLILLAPFLGEETKVDGLDNILSKQEWLIEHGNSNDRTVSLWKYLIEVSAEKNSSMPIVLAYGENDRFIFMHRLLSRFLKNKNVFTKSGGHNWKTWRVLWGDILEAKLFDF